MNKDLYSKRAKRLWIIWLLSYVVGGIIYQTISINAILENTSMDTSLLQWHNLIWFLVIIIFYNPALFFINKYSKLGQNGRLALISRVLQILHTIGIIVYVVAIAASLLLH